MIILNDYLQKKMEIIKYLMEILKCSNVYIITWVRKYCIQAGENCNCSTYRKMCVENKVHVEERSEQKDIVLVCFQHITRWINSATFAYSNRFESRDAD